jgi:ATP-dependent protease HslVU (ClpYQ) ATPase subunit
MCEGTTITIDEEMVTERLGDMVKSVDLSKFIL